MSTLKTILALTPAGAFVNLLKIAIQYEKREVRETAIGWNPGENTEQAGEWTLTKAEDSPSGEDEYHRTVRKPR